MIEISIPRIKRIAIIMGVVGTVASLAMEGVYYAAGFMTGAALALLSIESWAKLAASLNPESRTKPSATLSGFLLVFRYGLIAAAMYVTIKVLGVSPMAVLLGLFVSFAAVVVELLQQVSRKK